MADEVNEITMPKLGETVTEGTLATWLKSVGDEVTGGYQLTLGLIFERDGGSKPAGSPTRPRS